MLTNDQYPIALILTHRRGVGIMICKEKSVLDNPDFDKLNLFHQIKDQKTFLEDEGVFEFLPFKEIFFSRAIGKTAENLFAIYKRTLEKSSLLSNQIKTLIVGVGPGSFTGLRLGCAFVNGIKIASSSKVCLLPVTTYLTPDLLAICKKNSCEAECIQQLGDYQPDDESTGYITFFDLIVCLIKAKEEKREFVDSLLPEYGKEPGPVLKLREGVNL